MIEPTAISNAKTALTHAALYDLPEQSTPDTTDPTSIISQNESNALLITITDALTILGIKREDNTASDPLTGELITPHTFYMLDQAAGRLSDNRGLRDVHIASNDLIVAILSAYTHNASQSAYGRSR